MTLDSSPRQRASEYSDRFSRYRICDFKFRKLDNEVAHSPRRRVASRLAPPFEFQTDKARDEADREHMVELDRHPLFQDRRLESNCGSISKHSSNDHGGSRGVIASKAYETFR